MWSSRASVRSRWVNITCSACARWACRRSLAAIKDSGGSETGCALHRQPALFDRSRTSPTWARFSLITATWTGSKPILLKQPGLPARPRCAWAYLAILSGYVDTVAVLGVEKWSDLVTVEAEAATAQEMDYDYEVHPGAHQYRPGGADHAALPV